MKSKEEKIVTACNFSLLIVGIVVLFSRSLAPYFIFLAGIPVFLINYNRKIILATKAADSKVKETKMDGHDS